MIEVTQVRLRVPIFYVATFFLDRQKYDEDQKVVLEEYLMDGMMVMLVPHTHSLTDEVCKPVSRSL